MNEWISVEDQLPKEGQICVVYRKDSHLHPNYDPNVTIKVYSPNKNGLFLMCSVQPTHWMALPDPPLDK